MNSGLGFLFEEERAKAAKQAEKRTEKRVRKERNKQLIKKMIHRGDTIAEIAEFLEINIEEVEKAKKELKL